MDVFYVNRIPMLCGIEKIVRYGKVIPLPNHTVDAIYKGLDQILSEYMKTGMRIKEIRCNNKFKTLMNDISDEMDVQMQYSAP